MPLSATARRALYGQQTREVFVGLIRVSHADLGTLRFANANADVTSRGLLYDGRHFEAQVPPQVEGQEPTVTITIQNVDRLVEAALAGLTSEPQFTYEVVLASARDTVVLGPYQLPLRSSQTTMGTLRLTLGGGDPILSRKFPRAVFDQSSFPGLAAAT